MKGYKLICMSFDGDYQTETAIDWNSPRRERVPFETVQEAWEFDNDMGSRWYFYPFHFVVSASGQTIIDTPYGMGQFKGKRVKTVQAIFKELSELPELKNAGVEEFALVLMGLEFAK